MTHIFGERGGRRRDLCVYKGFASQLSITHIQLAIQLANMDRLPPPLPPPHHHHLCQQCYFRQRCRQNLQDDFFYQFSNQHLYPPIYDGPLINDEQMSKYDDRQRQRQLSPSPPQQLLVNEAQCDDRQRQQQQQQQQPSPEQPLVNEEQIDDRQEQLLVNGEQRHEGQPEQPLVNMSNNLESRSGNLTINKFTLLIKFLKIGNPLTKVKMQR